LIEKFKKNNPNVNIKVFRNEINKGLGFNFWATASRAQGKYYMIVFGDGGIPPDEIKKLVNNIGKADMILAHFNDQRGFFRRTLSKIFVIAINVITSNNIIKKENNIYELEELLNNNIHKLKLGSVVNVTDHFVMINLEGNRVYDLLSSGCPFNFNNFSKVKRSVVQTIFAHIDVIIHHRDTNNLNLFVRRSFSEHLWSWINDCASRL